MQFSSGSTADLLKLIAEHPLAWLVNHGSAGFDATPLPMLAETDAEGRLVSLLGHCSRRNAQVAALQANPNAVLLFSGPHAYISPALVSKPRWVPTWNFAVAMIAVEVEFIEDETLSSVEQLTDTMEASQPNPWTIADAGERMAQLLPRIIAFRAHVRAIDARFKLGQDETAEVAAELIAGTDGTELSDWMRRMNADRLPVPTTTQESLA
ncbi:transcriptional regulator [Sphingomonas zeicaulis]|uniref:FMN-binding negative transcriptional regulator n=1 Tax=Sphingomonas zeicaulis TaxID=1632740 RepID=UPI003D1C2AAA